MTLQQLNPILLRSFSLYRQTLRMLQKIKQQNAIQKGVRSRKVAVKIPSGKMYRYVKENMNASFRDNKKNQLPLSHVQYLNEYRLIWILRGFECLHRDASQTKFVKLKLRLSPQLNILRQALYGYGNEAFKELLVRSFVVEAQNVPYYIIDKQKRKQLRLNRKFDKISKERPSEKTGYMVRHITSNMTEEMISEREKDVLENEEEHMFQSMVEEEIEIERRLRDRF